MHGCILRGIIFAFVLYAFSFAGQLSYDYLKDVQLANNKVGLSYLEQPAVSRLMDHSFTLLQYGTTDEQTKTQFANLIIPGYFFNIALTVKHDVISGIPQTEVANDGSFLVNNYFNHEKSAAMLTFSQKAPLLPLYYGVNAKAYQQKVLNKNMSGIGFDAGVMLKVGSTIIGATCNDINNTSFEWEHGTVDSLQTNFSYHFTQLLPFGYFTYVGSNINDDYLKVGLDILGITGIETKVLLTDILSASVSCSLDLGAFEVGIRQDFNEVYGGNSQVFMTLRL